MDNIKIIRLQSGEDIIATYTESNASDGTVLLSNPMTLMFKRLPTGKAIMLMGPWLPVELIESNSTWLYTDDILSIMQPKASIIDYYLKSVDEMSLEMFERSDELDEALSSMDSIDVDDSFSVEELLGNNNESETQEAEDELRMEMENLRKDIKKRLLH